MTLEPKSAIGNKCHPRKAVMTVGIVVGLYGSKAGVIQELRPHGPPAKSSEVRASHVAEDMSRGRRLQAEYTSFMLDIIQKGIVRLHRELEKAVRLEGLGPREREGKENALINSSFYDA
jgi:hypothetical protein